MTDVASKKIFSVAEITRRIKGLLERDVGDVWIEGEVSNCRRPASGHLYFTLKDSSAQISAVLFRGNQKQGVTLKDGTLVRVYGKATVYERGGNYQILVRMVEEAGKGALQQQFEELKERLRKEGLFDAEAKKALPMLPRHVGVVTSRTGAALRDILNVIERRFPNLHVVIAPAMVQGDGAARDIAQAIELLNSRDDLDVLIVGRGGGSIEDLWAFNEEPVARAIWNSRIPVISAVGHEIDFTIADFVADLRAPTPSAAAELVVGRKDEFMQSLSDTSVSLARLLRQSVLEQQARFSALAGSYVFREPQNIIRSHSERLKGIHMSLTHELTGAARQVDQALDDASHRLASHANIRCERLSGVLNRAESALRTMNPKGVLKRGYSITKGADGKCLVASKGLKKGSKLITVLSDGEIASTVNDIKNKKAD